MQEPNAHALEPRHRSSGGQSMSARNAVIFMTDGHRKDLLGCYGNDLLSTPEIDEFAGDGVRFERAFGVHSVCMPTRASVYTGRYPHIHGVWANGCRLRESEVTMPQVLSEAGWATGAAGKIHHEPQQAYDGFAPQIEGPYYGFDEAHLCENRLGEEYLAWIDQEYPELSEVARSRTGVPEEAHELQWITSQAIDFIERQVEADTPFFCHCSYHELSPPCNAPEGWEGHYDPADVPIPELKADDLACKPDFYRECYEGYLANGRQPDEPTLRRSIASCYDQMRFIDHQFGRVMNTLEDLGVADDTIVLFIADHGLSLNDHFQWRHGPFLFDEVTNIPMIWRLPGGASGAVTEEMVEQVDVMPTILDALGVEQPAGVQGHSMLPLLRGDEGATGRDSVLMQEREAPDLAARGLEPERITQWAVRTQDWKLVHYPGEDFGELYDLQSDPGEFRNVWGEPDYEAPRAEMERLLLDRIAESRDPLPERHYDW
ncbi:MAG: sulfatase-like hydrolase/transferase [Armatimonadia bacterium]|nr:sulfatase-like hydrolase/transferase [Armatimonadia bacterium]